MSLLSTSASSSTSHTLSHDTDQNTLTNSQDRLKDSQWSSSTPHSTISVGRPSRSAVAIESDPRSRTPSPILGGSTTSPTARASDGHFQHHLSAQGPSLEDISVLLGHDWNSARLPRSISHKSRRDTAHEEDSDVDGDGEWVDHLELDPDINALMDKDDSPRPSVALPDTLKNGPQNRDAILLRLQQFGLLPGQPIPAGATPVEQELSQMLYGVLDQMRQKDDDLASSKQLLQFTRQHALSLLSASVVTRSHERTIERSRQDRLQTERDGFYTQCGLLAKRLAQCDLVHAKEKAELQQRLSQRERCELAAYMQLSQKIPGIEDFLDRYLLPRSELYNRHGIDVTEQLAKEDLKAAIKAAPPAAAAAAADVAMATPQATGIGTSTVIAPSGNAAPGSTIVASTSEGAFTATQVEASSAAAVERAEREGSEDYMDMAAVATMPLAKLTTERLQLTKDLRQLRARSRDQTSQVQRLSDELRTLRATLVSQGIPSANATHARAHNKAEMLANSELGEERGKGRGSDPTAHFIQRQVWQRERRRKRASAMGDAAAEHLILASDRLARLREENEKKIESDRLAAERLRQEQRARAREEMHDRYLDNPTYKMYPYPGESRAQSARKRKSSAPAARSGTARRTYRPRGASGSMDRVARKADARRDTPPRTILPSDEAAVYFGGHPPRTPGRESHARGKALDVEAQLTTPGGSAMSELLQAANSLLSPSKQAKQAREAQARAQGRGDKDEDAESSRSLSDDSRLELQDVIASPFYPNGTPIGSRAGLVQNEITSEVNSRRKRRRVDRGAEAANGPVTPLASHNGFGKVVPFSPLDLLADQAAASSQNAMSGHDPRSRALSDLAPAEPVDPGLAAYNPPGASGFRRFVSAMPGNAGSFRPNAPAAPSAPAAYGVASPAASSVLPSATLQRPRVNQYERSESAQYRGSEGTQSPSLRDEDEEDDEMDDDGYDEFEGQYDEGTVYDDGRDEEDDGGGDADDLTPYYQARPRGDRRIPYTRWTIDEDRKLMSAIADYGQKWKLIAKRVGTRTYHQCRQRFLLMRRKEAAAAGRTLGGRDLSTIPRTVRVRRRRHREDTEGGADEGDDGEHHAAEQYDDDESSSRPEPQSFTSAMASHMASLAAGLNGGGGGSEDGIVEPNGRAHSSNVRDRGSHKQVGPAAAAAHDERESGADVSSARMDSGSVTPRPSMAAEVMEQQGGGGPYEAPTESSHPTSASQGEAVKEGQ